MISELVTAPASTIVSSAEAKTHLRVTSSSDDTYIAALINVAGEMIEGMCGNRFVSQTWKSYIDDFPLTTELVLPFGKVVSVTHLKYTDYLGTVTTWSSSNYTVDTVSSPGKIDLAYGIAWPSVTLKPVNGIEIQYVTGYSAVPYRIKQAVLLAISHLYENREPAVIGRSTVAMLPLAIDTLIADYRMDIGV